MKKSLLLIAATAFAFYSCSEDETTPAKQNDVEVLTTLKAVFTELGTTKSDTFTFRSADGAVFGRSAKFDTIRLAPLKAYSLSLLVLDESKQVVEDKTPEIVKEGKEHQFFFKSNPLDLLITNYTTTNKDSLNLPIGNLVGSITTKPTVGSGTYTVELVHEPVKTNAGVANNNRDNAGGETDISVAFPVIIK
eukprot:gene51077-62461_t